MQLSRYRQQCTLLSFIFNAVVQELSAAVQKLLKQFYQRNNQRKPAAIIMYRDGVSEGQFQQVTSLSLLDFVPLMLPACHFCHGS